MKKKSIAALCVLFLFSSAFCEEILLNEDSILNTEVEVEVEVETATTVEEERQKEIIIEDYPVPLGNNILEQSVEEVSMAEEKAETMNDIDATPTEQSISEEPIDSLYGPATVKERTINLRFEADGNVMTIYAELIGFDDIDYEDIKIKWECKNGEDGTPYTIPNAEGFTYQYIINEETKNCWYRAVWHC